MKVKDRDKTTQENHLAPELCKNEIVHFSDLEILTCSRVLQTSPKESSFRRCSPLGTYNWN